LVFFAPPFQGVAAFTAGRIFVDEASALILVFFAPLSFFQKKVEGFLCFAFFFPKEAEGFLCSAFFFSKESGRKRKVFPHTFSFLFVRLFFILRPGRGKFSIFLLFRGPACSKLYALLCILRIAGRVVACRCFRRVLLPGSWLGRSGSTFLHDTRAAGLATAERLPLVR